MALPEATVVVAVVCFVVVDIVLGFVGVALLVLLLLLFLMLLLWSINVNLRLLKASVEFLWWVGGWVGVCTVIFVSNRTTVLRLCCCCVVVTIRNIILGRM